MDWNPLGKIVLLIIACYAYGSAGEERLEWSNYSIINMMNQSQDPCDDFYEYACGGYIKDAVLAEHEATKSLFHVLHQQMLRKLKTVLEQPESDYDQPSERLAKTHYQACMNETAAETKGWEPVKKFISQLGGWPVLEGDRWQKRPWLKIEADVAKLFGRTILFSFFVSVDEKNTKKNVLKFDQPRLALIDRDYYLESKYENESRAYIQFINATIINLGGDAETAYSTAQEIFDFERKLAELTEPEEDRRDHENNYRSITVAYLKNYFQQYQRIDIGAFFKYVTDHGYPIGENQKVVINGLPYLYGLQDVVKDVDKRIIANYQIWNVIMKVQSYLPPSLRGDTLAFQKVLNGVKSFPPRYLDCIRLVEEAMREIVGAMYVKSLGPNTIKEQAETIIRTIDNAMEQNIRTSDWMDDQTKANALKKLKMMQRNVAYPDYYTNETKLMHMFRGVTLSNKDFFANMLTIAALGFKNGPEYLTKDVNKKDWLSGAAVVNAFYVPMMNTITFPIGILNFPFFNDTSKKYQNYGRMGLFIGHEITHGFDNTGKQYDENGNLQLWWDAETKQRYSEKAQCFIDQYSGVTEELTGRNVNGILTLGENIADNGAAKLSHRAYKIWLSSAATEIKEEETMDGLTSDQLYFISFAQAWCHNMRPALMRQRMEHDTHAPNKIRVNVPLQNYPEFSNSFNCTSGTRMNPVKKCHVW